MSGCVGGDFRHLCWEFASCIFLILLVFLLGINSKQEIWELVLFSIIWVIWNALNELLFKEKKVEVEEMVEQVKIKTWLWVTDLPLKVPNLAILIYVNWFSNPAGCVGFRGADWNDASWLLPAWVFIGGTVLVVWCYCPWGRISHFVLEGWVWGCYKRLVFVSSVCSLAGGI